MRFSPILIVHICCGSLAVLSGAAAMGFRKGGQRHRVAGSVFVMSMLGLGATGAYLGFTKHQTLNGAMGILTFYLVGTAWSTARRKDGETDLLDLGALMVPLAMGVSLVIYGVNMANSPAGIKGEYDPSAYFIFGFLALLFAAGDVRMLASGGVFGARRIARHLRRMCFAFFIATGSFFLGRQSIFPAAVRKSGVLYLLSFLPLMLMIFWLLRIRLTNAFKGELAPPAS